METLKWQVLNNGRLEKLMLGAQFEYFKFTCERVKYGRAGPPIWRA